MARRTRRDNAGQSDGSWKKHRLLWRAAYGQACAYRRTHPDAHCVIIDTTAGDGEGVPTDQLEMFGTPPTWPTPLLATRLAASIGKTDVILCEKLKRKRDSLAEKFPSAVILRDYAEAPGMIRPEHRWALVLNDPCGYAGNHGIEVLQDIARRVRLDAIIVFNEVALRRLLGMEAEPVTPDTDAFVARVRALRQQVAWMVEPGNWAQRLQARQMAQSILLKPSAAFHYRIFVLSHTLSQTLRPPTWERVL